MSTPASVRGLSGSYGLAVACSGLGILLVCFSGWLGGEMVYVHGLGVASASRRSGASGSSTRRVA